MMYLGDKPVKAIARSKNNLLNAPSVLKFKGNTTQYYFPVDLNGTYSFSFFVKAYKITSDASFVCLTIDGAARHVAIWGFANKRVSYTFTGHITAIDFINWCNVECAVTEIMLNEGSTALPYEPYNQLFTVPIKKCVGKNLFDISKANVTIRDDGYFISNVYSVASWYNLRVSPGKTYYIKATAKGLEQGAIGVRLALSVQPKKNGKYVYATSLFFRLIESLNPYTMSGKFTVPDNVTWVSLQSERDIVFKDFMINEGDTELPYEPYTEWYEY